MVKAALPRYSPTMDFLIPFLCAAVSLGVAFYVNQSMACATTPSLASDEKENLIERKNKLVRDLREIELDLKTDKLAPDDYERLKLQTHHDLSNVLKELDRHA